MLQCCGRFTCRRHKNLPHSLSKSPDLRDHTTQHNTTQHNTTHHITTKHPTTITTQQNDHHKNHTPQSCGRFTCRRQKNLPHSLSKSPDLRDHTTQHNSSHHITSHHNSSQHITSHHITTHHNSSQLITTHHNTTQLITTQHISHLTTITTQQNDHHKNHTPSKHTTYFPIINPYASGIPIP